MKQKDIAIIMVVAFVSGIVAFFATNLLFSKGAKNQKVETVDPISTSFELPNKTYFNQNSVNPTQLIRIGNTDNTEPFKGTTPH